MSPTSSFADLMARLENGDSEAERIVYQRFAENLVRAVQHQLGRKYNAKIDAESAVLSAFGSFFAHRADGDYADLTNWEQLWGLLLIMARHKLADRRDRFQAACRNVDREVSLDALRDQLGSCQEPVDPNPTPAEVALLAEQVECLFQSFTYNHAKFEHSVREVMALSLQGYPKAEIAQATGYSARSIDRILAEAQKRLERMLGLDEKGKNA